MVTMSGQGARERIVAIETTGRLGSVAVAEGDTLLGMTRFSADLRHAVELLPAIDRMCETMGWRSDQLHEVYVSSGPGSFTGCRIGVTVARTLALAVGVRLVRVPTVEVLARNALEHDPPPEHLAVLIDAQRRQLYATVYHLNDTTYVRDGEVRMGSATELLSEVPRPCAVLGEAVAYHRQSITEMGLTILPEHHWVARADHAFGVGRMMARSGEYVLANQLVPIYIRLPEAEERWRQRHGTDSVDT